MSYIHNNKKYDESTSELLVKKGFSSAMNYSDGEVAIYRTKKGTMWGTFRYWPNAFGPQDVSHFVGEDACKSYLTRRGFVSDVETLFGQLEEG